MADYANPALAKKTYDTLCRALDSNDWNYEKNDEKLTIECSARGEDLPIGLNVKIDPDRMLAIVLSPIPFEIQEDKRIDAAIAISFINNMLVHGCFDYDITEGHIFFRMTNSFADSALSEDAFLYLLYCTCQIVDEYNDKLLMLSKGMLTLEQFLESLSK